MSCIADSKINYPEKLTVDSGGPYVRRTLSTIHDKVVGASITRGVDLSGRQTAGRELAVDRELGCGRSLTRTAGAGRPKSGPALAREVPHKESIAHVRLT